MPRRRLGRCDRKDGFYTCSVCERTFLHAHVVQAGRATLVLCDEHFRYVHRIMAAHLKRHPDDF